MAAPLATNQRTVGGYTVGERIGRGAASEVYAASHPQRGAHLAIKLLHGTLESTSTHAVIHPNVVRIVDVGADFVVMERIEGEDLAARLARGPLGEATARRLFAAIAEGMAAVHAAGLVHRDLKPSNIMLRGEQPIIVDFGIAKWLGEASVAATGRRIGTPAYMAPEQMTAGQITPAIDIWSLGAMLFETVTGALPFAGFADGRAPQLFEVAPRARVSPALDALIARCLDRDPGRRPASMLDVSRSLRGEDADEDARITADAGPLLAPPVPPPRARPRALIYALVTAAVLAVSLVVVVTTRDTPPPPPVVASPVIVPPPPPPLPPAPVLEEPPAVAAPTSFVVELTSTPAGARIRVNGKPRGRTPMQLSLSRPAAITVERAGYRTSKLRAERAGPLDVRLVPLPKRRTETLD